jgi:uncharacterized protein (DUF488 family)
MPKVYSLGYAQPGAEHQLEEMMQEPSMLLIDTRKWPYIKPGKGKDYWVKTWDRSALAEKYGERYHWAGEHLGNPNAFNGGPLALINPIRGINGLLYYLSRGSSLVLLCGCKQYERCHRSLIVQKLAIGLTTAHVAAAIIPETPERLGERREERPQ